MNWKVVLEFLDTEIAMREDALSHDTVAEALRVLRIALRLGLFFRDGETAATKRSFLIASQTERQE